jgi:copper transport protein
MQHGCVRYRLLLLLIVPAALLVGCGGSDARARPREVAQAPAPPSGSVVLAQESRELAVALAVRPGRPLGVTATIVGQSGRGVDGLGVELSARGRSGRAAHAARSCGHGCYAATLSVGAPTELAVKVTGAGSPRTVVFPVAGRWPPADGQAFLGRASRAFRRLRSVRLVERLSSGPGHSILTTWKLAAPDRLEYEIHGGAGGIVIGTRRWDRPKPGAPWTPSETTLLPQPTAPWGTRIANARVLDEMPGRLVVSWVDPVVPAWFTGTFDRRTALPLELRMTAPAHFMRHRYLAFNRKVRIEPPAVTR